MKKLVHIDSINAYHSITDQETWHPLVSIIDFATFKKTQDTDAQALSFGFYSVFLKNGKHCDIRYGQNYYDYQEGTLLFIAPGQVISIEEDGDDYQPSGYALLFHPDLLRGTSLAPQMKDFSFFSYDVNEALHLSEQERLIVMECFGKIDHELRRSIDKHSKRLIATNIDLFLSYALRFYDRQFITRENANSSILGKFEALLEDYFQAGKPKIAGIPTVSFFAGELHLSANYFGDLVKKETGKTAQEHIQQKLIAVAKEKILHPGDTISEIAYELGFNYPQHFTRFFKRQVGYSPNEYRTLN